MNKKTEHIITKISHYVIAIGVICIILVSANHIYFKVPILLNVILTSCLLFFTIEFIYRIFINRRVHVSYFITFRGIVEILGILLTPIAFALGADPQKAWMLSAVWILILIPDSDNIRLLRRVITLRFKALLSVLVLFFIIIFLAATVVYLIEWEIQPESFVNIPTALWWAVTTLTTTGYGDMVPISLFSRMIAAFVMFSGLGLFGVWTGILTTGFSEELKREKMLKIWSSIEKVPFFSGINPAAIAEIAGFLHPVDLPAKATVIKKGQASDCMYFIVDGEVEIHLPNRKIRLGEGAFFGEMSLLEHRARSADVETTKITKLLSLDIVDFNQLISRYPSIAEGINAEAKARARMNKKNSVMWKESFTLGVEIIDLQHRELFTKTGKLLEKIMEAVNDSNVDYKQDCIDAILFLKDYAVRHFADEEAYQLSINYKDYNAHKKLHENFVKTVLEHEAKMVASDFALKDIEEFTGMLIAWLIYHVADADQKIGKEAVYTKPMDKHSDIVFYSICDVLHKMADFDITSMREVVVHTETFHDSFAVKVGLAGNISGSITLVYPTSFVMNMMHAILKFIPEQIGELEISALLEISNIISASICNLIAMNKHILCDITTPLITRREAILPDERVTVDTGQGILEANISIQYHSMN